VTLSLADEVIRGVCFPLISSRIKPFSTDTYTMAGDLLLRPGWHHAPCNCWSRARGISLPGWPSISLVDRAPSPRHRSLQLLLPEGGGGSAIMKRALLQAGNRAEFTNRLCQWADHVRERRWVKWDSLLGGYPFFL